MLIFDQLKKGDAQLRWVAIAILAGMAVLLAGLWYVQVIAFRRFSKDQVSQSYRTVRLPGIRGRILDRNGTPLADNLPRYNLNLYLEELRPSFKYHYVNRVKKDFLRQNPGRKRLTSTEVTQLERIARYAIVSNVVWQVGSLLQHPLTIEETNFHSHYWGKLYMPLPVVEDLAYDEVARFAERLGRYPGLELESEAVRRYPYGQTAAHVLGYVRRRITEDDDDPTFYHYRLPEYVGEVGIEGRCDEALRGQAGVKSLLVNSLGYRQSERLVTPPQMGQNVVLTIDLPLQQAVERALRSYGPRTRGAAVVLDVRTGDILALTSAPAYDPRVFLGSISTEQWQELVDPDLRPLINRATAGSYPPGSIFKIVVALACLEANQLDPQASFYSPGYFQLGAHAIGDTAPAGYYDFRRAFLKSSNTYFIHYGLQAGLGRLLDMGHRFYLGQGFRSGEHSEVPMLHEQRGFFPSMEWIRDRKGRGQRWTDGQTANLCIGQGEIAVTPLQMAVMTAAIANGGKVFWPRLVQRLEAPEPQAASSETISYPPAQVRGTLNVRPGLLDKIREVMRADVDDPDGTGREAQVPGMGVCGKTGTAEVKRGQVLVDKITWFVSFAPLQNPEHAVVVMIESGQGGGKTCAPVARQIYQAIRKLQAARPLRPEEPPAQTG